MQARTNFEFRFVISEIFLQIFLLSTYARDKKVQCPTKFKELQFFFTYSSGINYLWWILQIVLRPCLR